MHKLSPAYLTLPNNDSYESMKESETKLNNNSFEWMEESSDKYCFQKSYALEYMILDCNFNKKQI